jgi:hypothetical protein
MDGWMEKKEEGKRGERRVIQIMCSISLMQDEAARGRNRSVPVAEEARRGRKLLAREGDYSDAGREVESVEDEAASRRLGLPVAEEVCQQTFRPANRRGSLLASKRERSQQIVHSKVLIFGGSCVRIRRSWVFEGGRYQVCHLLVKGESASENGACQQEPSSRSLQRKKIFVRTRCSSAVYTTV